jgi:flagellar motor switch protein FliM
MPTLDAVNERIASIMASGLGGRTRLQLRVNVASATLLKFVDFNVLLAPPATVCVLSLGQGNGMAVAVLEPGLAESLLAAALGDRKARPSETPPEGRRELTSVERLVLRRLMGILTDAMATAWAPVLPFKPEVVRFEPDPRLATIAPANEVAILSSFEISGGISGHLQLAIPYTAVEPAKKLLSSPPRMHSGGDRRFASAFAEELAQVEVEVRATFGRTSVRLERLVNLKVGDVLVLSTDEGAPLPIFVQGRPKLTGTPRVMGNNLAIVVERDVRGKTKADAEAGAPTRAAHPTKNP